MGTSWLSRLLNSKARTQSRPRPARRRRKLRGEKLESREVFAALTATLNGTILSVFDGTTTTDYDTTVAAAVALDGGGTGTLAVTGDADNNAFIVSGSSVTIGLVTLNVTAIDGLSLDGGGGIDRYAFNADTSITPSVGVVTIANTGPNGGTLDFVTSTVDVTVDLNSTTNVVSSNLTIEFTPGTTIRRIIGGAGNDTFIGDANINLFFGKGGNDTLEGRDGNDTLVGEAGDDELIGGNGFDNYVFRADTALGTDSITDSAAGNQNSLDFTMTTELVTVDLRQAVNVVNAFLTLNIDSGVGTFYAVKGGQGGNIINGDDLKNVITGGAANDLLIGNGGDDGLNGGLGNDTLRGGDGNDTLVGADGNDTFEGGAGDDNLSGGTGDNRFIFAANTQLGTDKITDAGAKSALDFAQTSSAITVNLGLKTKQVVNSNLSLILGTTTLYGLTGGAGSDTLIGNNVANVLVGNGGDDTLRGMGGNDQMNGNSGDDNLEGGGGNDVLLGSTGNDVLMGTTGDDILNGGEGSDVLVGGLGVDLLVAGTEVDILIGGASIYTLDDFKAVRTKLLSTLGMSIDAAAGVLTTGTTPLDSSTITDDGVADKLYGNATSEVAPGAADLFFSSVGDNLPDFVLDVDENIVV
jgi:Ca2+-binding RTX toxin-like protein